MNKLSALLILMGVAIIPSFKDDSVYKETKGFELLTELYLDLSLRDDLVNPYITCTMADDKDVALVDAGNDIYSFYVDRRVLEIADYGLKVCDTNGYQSDFITGAGTLDGNGYNYICLGDGTSIKGFGYYGTRSANPGATYKTQRVWLNNDNHYDDDWNGSCVNVVGYEYYGLWFYVDMEKVVSNDRDYYYADIPFQTTSIRFINISNNEEGHNYLIYNDKYIETLGYGVCYHVGTTSFEDISIDKVSAANINVIALVAESYLTYGKAPSNGAFTTTIQSVFKTWFENKSATRDELKARKILDYTGYAKNNNSYEGLEKTAEFSVNEKWNSLCSQAGVDPNMGELRGNGLSLDNNTWKVIGAIGITSLIIIGGVSALFIYSRKKRNA